MFVKLSYVLDEVIEDANEDFGSLYKVDEERLRILRQYCDVVDEICQEGRFDSKSIEIDSDNMNVIVEIAGNYLSIYEGRDKFLKLADRAVKYGFRTDGTGEDVKLIVWFVFPPIHVFK